ncbi:glycosyltransferase involved in cell wall biosynthesis [Caulobacter sp. BE264]|uniref:glycosyltransferase n=1 Tax=Caulobacter sp. BE264 TaxID=2817724 RepID=UPI00285DDCE5|nr:glycosyltransferase [Caulobacter sp. BE264]MDR7230276.1 glycosyltransferase involved in cell wall biosynthesis [Caulobacter sp. BE264]
MKSRLLQIWRRLPTPMRRWAHVTIGLPRAGLDRLGEAVAEHQRREAANAALRRALRNARPKGRLPTAPVTIIGFHGAVHGLGEGARMLARGFADAGVPVRALDLSASVGFAAEIAPAFPPPEAHERGVVISHINPPELLRWASATEGRLLQGRRHIGYWAWELQETPSDWRPAFDFVDEVWTPSAFAADAIRRVAPKRVKVTPVPYPLYLNPRPAPDRKRFGLPDDRVVVLVAFDLRSTAERKNPRAALRAFQEAASRASRPATLVCKIVGADLYPEILDALASEVAHDPSIRLLTDNLSAHDMAVLTASSDIVLSLHRSEGYGLLLAEAIWLGKPTVATGWSSNVEFTDPASGVLVDYRLIPVEGDGVIYRSGEWADANVDDAAEKLARLISDDAWRRSLADATERNDHVSFNRDAWTTMIRTLAPLN